MIRSEHMKSCLATQIRFMLFKGPGSLKTIFKIGGNVDELKAYRLITLTPPPHPFSFYTTFKTTETAASVENESNSRMTLGRQEEDLKNKSNDDGHFCNEKQRT
jgi:hypothetical protein